MPWSRNTSWQQGSVLARKDFQTVGLNDTQDNQMAVAISHDCDIANDDLDVEPAVEFVFARIIGQGNGNYTYAKNPRTLHLDYLHDGQEVFLEMLAAQKFVLQKNKLDSVQPDETYKLNSRQVLQSWLAARYKRHALPNSLVERLRAVFGYMEKEGKKNSVGILSFQLSYDPQTELTSTEPYELWLSVVYSTDDDAYGLMAEKIAENLKAEFPRLLEKKKALGTVDLRKCEAVSEMEFTLRDMRETEKFLLEHLSHRIEPPGPMV